MKRLIEKGLMFGNLVHVAGPVMVERYNRALEHLTGKRTELDDFYIDIAGYSPEVGQEFGDPLYLNHDGVNRQFILLTTEQKRAPLLDAMFSVSRTLLRRWIGENESALFALTARDAVAGELVNSVFDIREPARLFDIRRIRVEADTVSGTLRDARALAGKVDRFMTEEDAWFDDVLIAEMIGIAGRTGDVTRNPVRLNGDAFGIGNFWTAHFGPLYIFQDLPHPGVVTTGDPGRLGDLPVARVLALSDRDGIARFLDENGLVEPIVRARGIDSAAILRQKMDFVLINALAGVAGDLRQRSRAEMRRLARAHADRLPPEFHGLAGLINWAEGGGPWPRITSDHPAYFYTLRAAGTPDADLVNMLLAELTPRDFRQLFICHKSLFYRLYRDWPEAKQAYVAEYLEREYQVDKAGARRALFGHEAPMEEPAPAPTRQDLIARVGPWGAVRRQ